MYSVQEFNFETISKWVIVTYMGGTIFYYAGMGDMPCISSKHWMSKKFNTQEEAEDHLKEIPSMDWKIEEHGFSQYITGKSELGN